MHTAQTIRLVIIYSFFILHGKSNQNICRHSETRFIVEPSDKVVGKGQDATFTCSVRLSSQDDGYINWHIAPDVYRTGVSEEFSKLHENLTSLLKIYNIGQKSQIVQCLFYPRNEVTDETCFISREARTQVQYFPRESQLTCQPKKPKPILEGEILSISCKVLRCNPPVDMSFVIGGKSGISSTSSIVHDEGLTREISLQLETFQNLHMQNITCQVTSNSAFPGKVLECVVGPLYVLSLPHVQVHPRTRMFSLFQEHSLTMLCLATALPEVVNYTWSCTPSDVFEGCSASSSNWNISLVPRDLGDYTNISSVNVTCSASNSIGTSINTSEIIIVQPTINKTCCKYKHISNKREEPPYVHFHISTVGFKNELHETIAYHILNITVLAGSHDFFNIECRLNEKIIYIGQNIEFSSNRKCDFAMVVHLSAVDIGKELSCKVWSEATFRRVVMNLTAEFFDKGAPWESNSTMKAMTLFSAYEKEVVDIHKKWIFIAITSSLTSLLVFAIGCVSTFIFLKCCRLRRCCTEQDGQSSKSRANSGYESPTSEEMYEEPNMLPLTMSSKDADLSPSMGNIHAYDTDIFESCSTGNSQSGESVVGSSTSSSDRGYYVMKTPVFHYETDENFL